MPEQTHTPGPWKWYHPDPEQYTRYDKGAPHILNSLMADGRPMEAAPSLTYDETVLTYSSIDGESAIDCNPANARLIASAPELLAACRQAHYAITGTYSDGGHAEGCACSRCAASRVLSAAIAKATHPA